MRVAGFTDVLPVEQAKRLCGAWAWLLRRRWPSAIALVLAGFGHGPVLLHRLPVGDRVDETTSKQVSSTASALVSSACYLTGLLAYRRLTGPVVTMCEQIATPWPILSRRRSSGVLIWAIVVSSCPGAFGYKLNNVLSGLKHLRKSWVRLHDQLRVLLCLYAVAAAAKTNPVSQAIGLLQDLHTRWRQTQMMRSRRSTLTQNGVKTRRMTTATSRKFSAPALLPQIPPLRTYRQG